MINLMYHDISRDGDMSSGFQTEVADSYKVDAVDFEKQVKSCVGQDVLFTFDDGGLSFYTEAAPILEKYGFKGLFFISTAYIGSEGFMTKDQIKDLDARGHIMGSHTHNHLKNMSLLDRETIEHEWETSVSVLSGLLNKKVVHASLPNGNGNAMVKDIIQKVGITELYTSEPTEKILNYNGMNIMGRYTVLRSFPFEKVYKMVYSKQTRRKMHLKWYFISLIKKVLGKRYYNFRKIVATH